MLTDISVSNQSEWPFFFCRHKNFLATTKSSHSEQWELRSVSTTRSGVPETKCVVANENKGRAKGRLEKRVRERRRTPASVMNTMSP